jgi:anaerobic selenocysteine-containing dehydrogenase
MGEEEVKRAFCEMCHSRCRVVVHSKDGRLAKIEEDPSYPLVDAVFPPTRACLRLKGVKEEFYHPDRLKFPLKRIGEKGEGKWEQISWPKALDEIAERLKNIKGKYGAEAVAATGGTGHTHEQFLTRFLNLFGSPNFVGASTICSAPFVTTSLATFGWSLRHRIQLSLEKKASTQCVLIVGQNPQESYPRIWKSLRDAKEKGVKIIVIDPRKTQTTELADLWLQIRPGTDTALLMAMINVVIQEDLYDKKFVEKWCYGFDKLAERVREYPPERIAKITWLTAERIREAAKMFALNGPGVSISGMGLEHQQNGLEGIQAELILAAILGYIDVDGGMYLPGPSKCITEREMELSDILPPEQKNKQLGADRFKLIAWPGNDLFEDKRVWGKKCGRQRTIVLAHAPTLYRAILTNQPYPAKALITQASNPMLTQANVKMVYKALKNLELYVVCDYWLTPSAEIADYVLPIASWLERPYFSTGLAYDNWTVCGEQALPAIMPGEYEHWTDYEFCRGLGVRLGQEEYWPWKNLEEVYDYQLKPLDFTFKDFMVKGGYDFPPNEYRKHEKLGFGTPTGKVELYSTILEKLGYDPLPSYEESFENPVSTPDLAKEYPFMLITGGRFMPMYHSEKRQVDSLRSKHPHPLVQIHPETAARLEIGDGDWVWIETTRGRIRMKCKYFDGLDPIVVHAEHGWWFPELPGEEPWLFGVWESNINVLIDDDPDVCTKRGGGWPLKTALCKIYKVKQY